MEELITLYYGNFAILEERVKDFAQCTGCIEDRTVQGQIFLEEGTPRLDHHPQARWGQFLLECLLHNVAFMRRKSTKGTPEDNRQRKQRDGL